MKLYAVVPNSMADERTQSTFTWLNSVSRNRQHLHTMVQQTQIRQYYRSNAKVSFLIDSQRVHSNSCWNLRPQSYSRVKAPVTHLRFSEIDCELRNDTKAHPKASSASSIRTRAVAPEYDGDIDDGTVDPWLDEQSSHCGHASMFDVETYIDLDRPELLAILSSDPPEQVSHSGLHDAGAGPSESSGTVTDCGSITTQSKHTAPIDWEYSLAL